MPFPSLSRAALIVPLFLQQIGSGRRRKEKGERKREKSSDLCIPNQPLEKEGRKEPFLLLLSLLRFPHISRLDILQSGSRISSSSSLFLTTSINSWKLGKKEMLGKGKKEGKEEEGWFGSFFFQRWRRRQCHNPGFVQYSCILTRHSLPLSLHPTQCSFSELNINKALEEEEEEREERGKRLHGFSIRWEKGLAGLGLRESIQGLFAIDISTSKLTDSHLHRLGSYK